jgi:hypothetical protein
MDADVDTQEGTDGDAGTSRIARFASDRSTRTDRLPTVPAAQPTSRQIADAIVRFVLTGARG